MRRSGPVLLAEGSLAASGRSCAGCSDGAGSASGASADITRSGGKVTITSVPMRNFDLSVNVPPCRSTRLFAIGSPRPAPCSADLIEFDPWPKEASTIGISSRNARACVFHADVLAAGGCPTGLQPDISCLRRELYRVREQIKADLADSAFIGPKAR